MARLASIGCLFTLFRHPLLSCVCCIPGEVTSHSACSLFSRSVNRERNLTAPYYSLNNGLLNYRLLKHHLFLINKIYTFTIFCYLHLQNFTYRIPNTLLHYLMSNSHENLASNRISRIVFHPDSSCLTPCDLSHLSPILKWFKPTKYYRYDHHNQAQLAPHLTCMIKSNT